MKRNFIFAIFILALLITPFISAEIIINQQPNKVYNLGDSVTVPVSIFATSTISDDLHMDLICGGKAVSFCQNGVDLGEGEGKNMECYLVLNKDKIGETTGTCKISVYLSKQKGSAVTTDDFKISNLLTIYSVFSGETISELEQRYKGKNYGDFKNGLAISINSRLENVRSKYKSISKEELRLILDQGRDYVRAKSAKTLQSVKDKMGLV